MTTIEQAITQPELALRSPLVATLAASRTRRTALELQSGAREA